MINFLPTELIIEILEKLDDDKNNLFSRQIHLVNKLFNSVCYTIAQKRFDAGKTYIIRNIKQFCFLKNFDIINLPINGSFDLNEISICLLNHINLKTLKIKLKTSIHLDDIKLFFKNLKYLSNLERLTINFIKIKNEFEVNEITINKLIKSCPLLKKISLNFNSKLVSLTYINSLNSFKNLESLTLKNLSIFAHESVLFFPNLNVIKIKECILNFNIYHLLNACPNLKISNIQHDQNIGVLEDTTLSVSHLSISNFDLGENVLFSNLQKITLIYDGERPKEFTFLNNLQNSISLKLINYKLKKKSFDKILNSKVHTLTLKNSIFKKSSFFQYFLETNLKKIKVSLNDSTELFNMGDFFKNYEFIKNSIHKISISKKIKNDVYLELLTYSNLKKLIFFNGEEKIKIIGTRNIDNYIVDNLKKLDSINFYINPCTNSEKIKFCLNFLEKNKINNLIKNFFFYSNIKTIDDKLIEMIYQTTCVNEFTFKKNQMITTIEGERNIKNFLSDIQKTNLSSYILQHPLPSKRKRRSLEYAT